ncbi:hypothetical protein [Amycolatopsis minnesotensis]|uniref:hypothetical protein n=1 Tax=Amycolatopsis minnesotensis TaxID=337894 RepID=UPI0031CE7347
MNTLRFASTVDQRITEIRERYGPTDLVTAFIRQARPELVGAVNRTQRPLRSAGIDYA